MLRELADIKRLHPRYLREERLLDLGVLPGKWHRMAANGVPWLHLAAETIMDRWLLQLRLAAPVRLKGDWSHTQVTASLTHRYLQSILSREFHARVTLV